MKLSITTAILTIIALLTACNNAKPVNTAAADKPAKTVENKATGVPATSSASDTVKQIYDHAIKRNCSSIPPLLTDDFKESVGTSKDALDALCDSFTDSGKLTGVDVTGEEIKGDSATVKVSQTFKDGKKEEKEERMKKSGDKWLMGS